jgi:hypothetical protein
MIGCLVVTLVVALATAVVAQPIVVRAPFVIGAPGRLDAAEDQRFPRRYQRADSLLGAYADVEVVADPTWLTHEIESYARRAVDCSGVGRDWCRRERRQLGRARVIALASGVRAEVVWRSAGNVAVRLGWRRIVVTPSGTMTLDTPPADFAAALLAEYPSWLDARALEAHGDPRWALNEVDRLLYYADQVVDALPAVLGRQQRNHALNFVGDNLARIAELRALHRDGAGAETASQAFEAPAAGTSLALMIERLAAVRVWRTGIEEPPWCGAAFGWLATADVRRTGDF